MKFCTVVKQFNSLICFLSWGLCIYPIQIKALPFLPQYIQVDSKDNHIKHTHITRLLQTHSQSKRQSDKNSIDIQGSSLWSNLYDRSETSKTVGGTMQISWPMQSWAIAYGTLGGAMELDRKKPIRVEEIFSQCNIIIGNLKHYPLYCQLGLLDIPFGLNASAILPAELMYTHQISKSMRKKIGLNVILTSYPVLKQTQANFFLVYDPNLVQTYYKALSGGLSIYCPLHFYNNLKCNIGGGIHIHNTNYQSQWNIYAECILKFWRIYVERTEMKNDHVAWHLESSMHFAVLNRPVALVGLFEQGHFGQSKIYNNFFVGAKVSSLPYLDIVIGGKFDCNQLIYRIAGRGDAWSKLTYFIARLEFRYQ